MTDHSHSRDYVEQLRRLGVQDPGEIPIRTPVQAVAVLDDLTEIARGMRIPRFWGAYTWTEAVAQNGVLRLTAGRHGATIRLLADADNTVPYVVRDQAGFTSSGVVPAIGILPFGDTATAQESVLEWGFRGGAIGHLQLPMGFVAWILEFGLYLPPGNNIELINPVQNDDQSFSIIWDEVPFRSAINPPE